jgi:hypothetical protein
MVYSLVVFLLASVCRDYSCILEKVQCRSFAHVRLPACLHAYDCQAMMAMNSAPKRA